MPSPVHPIVAGRASRLAAFTVCLAWSVAADAQTTASPQVSPVMPASAVYTYPGIPITEADTGRMRPGWQDFSRYTDVWEGADLMCGQAVRSAQLRAWRGSAYDTMSYVARYRDTAVPPVVLAMASRCGADRILAQGIPKVAQGVSHPVFLNLLFLAVALRHDEQAAAILRAHLNKITSLEETANLGRVISRLLLVDAVPQRIQMMRPVLLHLDSLYQRAPEADQSYIRDAMITVADDILYRSMELGDSTQLAWICDFAVKTVKREKGLGRNLDFPPYNGNTGGNLLNAFEVVLRQRIYEHGPRSPEVVAWLRDMNNLLCDGADCSGWIGMLKTFGREFVYPESPYWFQPNGTAAPVTGNVPPVPPAKVTWVIDVDWSVGWGGAKCGRDCYKMWARLRRMIKTYGPRGLHVVLISSTGGFMNGSVLEPEQEASAIRQYFQDQQHIPATIVVQVGPWVQRPDPDNRRVYRATEWDYMWMNPSLPRTLGFGGMSYSPFMSFLLTDKGRIENIGGGGSRGDFDGVDEERWIKRMLGIS